MDNSLLILHPPPGTPNLTEGLAQLERSLYELGTADDPASVDVQAPGTRACMLLRRRLAVRGWVSPLHLLNDVPKGEQDSALRAVGSEVELAERTRPGQWFMTLSARKRVFASTEASLLRAASERLCPSDESDPVRLATVVAMESGPKLANANTTLLHDALTGQPMAVLQELSRMVAWGSSLPGLAALAATAGAERKRRMRDRQLESMGATTVFGRDAEQQRIQMFLRSRQAPQRVSALYVSGIGGSGKSTLLLAAEKELRAVGDYVVVRLDFDSPYLDPLSPELMDIAFLRELMVEEPKVAHEVQQIVLQLQSLADHRVQVRIEAEGDVQSSSSSRTVQRQAIQVQRAKYATKSGSAAESAGVSQQYERISALMRLKSLGPIHRRDVVLFLDTLENVSRLGLDAIDSVLEWLASVGGTLPQGELRAVLAGRDRLGSPNMQALADRFQEHGIVINPDEEVVLLDLDLKAGCELLKRFGMPDDDAALAAASLPRNPLVLRLAANAYHSSEADLGSIQQAYRDGRIDRQTASGYLAQRVIQHVPRQPARRYVVAAMALHEVTERLLRDVVIPVVDDLEAAVDRTLARKVYEGLLRASWLTIKDSSGALRWHAELRELALRMIQADPHHAVLAARVHSAAALWYERRRTTDHRAMAEYYQAMAEHRPLPPRVLEHAARYISPLNDKWPESQGKQTSVSDSSRHASEAELHRMQLEGMGGNAGEGDRLVAQGRAVRALDLYREWPTRAPGVAPTFVIRALALTGDWHGEEVAPEPVLWELSRHLTTYRNKMQRQQLERLYWLTRLEMLRNRQLSPPHLELLRDACRGLKFKQQNGAFFGLAGTLEALQSVELMGDTSPPRSIWLIAPAAWPPPEVDVGPELRFSMVRTAYGQLLSPQGRGRWVSTTLAAILVFDDRWPMRLIELRRLEVIQLPGPESAIIELGDRMRALRNAPLVEVEQFIASCRDVRVRVNLAKIAPKRAAWLLRGTLVEFHAPLAALLSAPLLDSHASDPSEVLLRLLEFISQLQLDPSAMLTLAEFDSDERRRSHALNLPATISAVVVALDRARVLADFCRALIRSPLMLFNDGDSEAVQRVINLCTRYLEWDRALDPYRLQGRHKEGI